MKVIYTVFLIGVLGLVPAILGKLSSLGIWVVTGIFILFVVLITIREIKKAKIIPIIIIIGLILAAQNFLIAQTFDELKNLSDESVSMLSEFPGSKGDLIREEKIQGSDTIVYLTIWDKNFFSQKKQEVSGVRDIKEITPQVFDGYLTPQIWILLIRSYTPGFISGTNDLYILDPDKKTITKLMVSGYIAKVFKKEGLLFIDHLVDEYMNPTYTQMYSIISVRGSTIISTTHQREVATETMK